MALDIPEDWEAAARAIREDGLRRILVIGATDLGKSSFCRFLADALIDAGREVTLVDGDCGQKDIGPPAAVTATRIKRDVPFSELKPEGFHFVGDTNPWGHLLALVVGVARLTGDAQTDTVIVNTTGLVHGPGRALKTAKVQALRPDVVVAIARADELAAILRGLRHCRVLSLRPSPAARRKSSEARRRARRKAFTAYFAGARRKRLSIDTLSVQGTLLFSGSRIDLGDAIHAERTPEGVIAVGDPCAAKRNVKTLPEDFATDLICGIADEAGICRGIGRIEGIDFTRRQLDVRTPVLKTDIRVVAFGSLYVDSDGRETGRVPRSGL